MTNTDFLANTTRDQAVAATRAQRQFVEQLAADSDRSRNLGATAAFVVQNRMFTTLALELSDRFGASAVTDALRD